MIHPSIEQIVAGEAWGHLAGCASCQRLGALAGVAVPASPARGDLDELPAVDTAMYAEWTELPDARGGMGRIFQARDRRLGRFVAIKQLHPGLDASERAISIARFEREARLTARLQHPAIVGVHEAGRLDGEPFYAMPLLRGVPLGQEIARRATLTERLALLRHLTTVAEAVAYAHGQGVVHRDIKPDNILVGEFGETVLIDWGLAKELADRTTGTPVGGDVTDVPGGFTQLGVGTPHYMPPEQAHGDEPDDRVDVYALGATLYHLLAGAPPYGDVTPTTVRRALAAGPPRPIGELVPDAPGELVDIVDRAMARERAARYQRVRDLVDELRRFQTGQLLRSRRYTLGELVRHFARRHRTALRISVIAAIVLAAVAVIAFVRIAAERDHAKASQQRAERELRRAQGVVASRLATDPVERMTALASGVRAVAPDVGDGQSPALEAVQGLVDAVTAGPAVVPLPHDGLIKHFVRAGDKLIGVDDARSLVVFDARSGRPITKYASELASPEFLEVAPDGARVVVCGFDPIGELYEVASGVRRRFEAKSNFAACAFLPDGRLITAAEDITIRDPRSLAVVARYPLSAHARSLAIGRSGLAVASLLDGALWSWRPDHAPERVAGATPGQLELAGEDRVLYHTGADQIVRTWRVDALAAAPTVLHQDAGALLTGTVVSPDGRFVAVGAFDVDTSRRTIIFGRDHARALDVPGIPELWWSGWLVTEHYGPHRLVDPETGGVVLELAAHHDEGGVDSIGEKLASRDRGGPAFLWDVSPGPATGLLLGHTQEIVAIAIRDDRVATASRDGSVRIWRAGTLERVVAGDSELQGAAWLGDAIAIGDLAGTVRVVEPATGRERARSHAGAPITVLTPSPSGTRIVIGALDGSLEVRDAGLAEVVALHTDSPVTAAALSPDGTRVVSGHADGSTRLWDLASGALVVSRPDSDPIDRPDDHEGHAQLAFTADGTAILAARPAGQTLVLGARDLADRGRLAGRAIGRPTTTDQVTALPEGTVIVHDLATGAARRLGGHRQVVLAAARSPDGSWLATASVDGSVRVTDLTTGAAITLGARDLGPATAIAAIDRDWIVVGFGSGAVRLWPATSRAALARACTILARFARTDEVAPYCAERTASDRT